jgi:hypothetical protein
MNKKFNYKNDNISNNSNSGVSKRFASEDENCQVIYCIRYKMMNIRPLLFILDF